MQRDVDGAADVAVVELGGLAHVENGHLVAVQRAREVVERGHSIALQRVTAGQG